MRRLLIGIGVTTALLIGGPRLDGQKATERYIPLGQSPGVSQKATSIGEIADVDLRARTVTLVDPAGRHTVRITEQTLVWLDRSKLKQTNLTGGFADLRKGRRVEVKYQDPDSRQLAEWVKVEVAQ